MTAEAVPYVIAIIAMFASFVVILGSVAIWSELPDKREPLLNAAPAPATTPVELRRAA